MSQVSVQRVYDDGWYVALVGESGRKYTPVVVMDSGGLKVKKIPNRETRELRPVEGCRPAKAVKQFRQAARTFGCTEGAAKFLKEAVA